MGLRELFIVLGPFNWKGLSSSQHNGPDGNIVDYGGSSCIKRLKCIGVQGTWYGHFKLSLSQLKGLAKTLGSFNPIWTGLFWLNLGTLEILKFSFFIKELSTLAYRCTHSRIKQTCLCGVGSDAFLGHSQCTNLTYLIFPPFILWLLYFVVHSVKI